MNGKVKVVTENGHSVILNMGDSTLVPAICGNYRIEPLDGNAIVLKSYSA